MDPMPTRSGVVATELEEAAAESGKEDLAEMLQTLVSGRRLRDISDLHFDLAI